LAHAPCGRDGALISRGRRPTIRKRKSDAAVDRVASRPTGEPRSRSGAFGAGRRLTGALDEPVAQRVYHRIWQEARPPLAPMCRANRPLKGIAANSAAVHECSVSIVASPIILTIFGDLKMVLKVDHIAPIVALLAGILILIVPSLLNYVVAFYLILVGLIGLNDIYHFVK